VRRRRWRNSLVARYRVTVDSEAVCDPGRGRVETGRGIVATGSVGLVASTTGYFLRTLGFG